MQKKILKPIGNRWLCHIDVTNVCETKHNCAYCTRYIRHLRPDQKYFMPMEDFELAVESLQYYPGRVGIMGGLPTKHPKFPEMCELLRSKFPKQKLQLWTSGEKEFETHKAIINETFASLSYNEHNDKQVDLCEHQITTLASEEVIEDDVLREELIWNCWVMDYWCPTIGYVEKSGRKSAFVCELMLGLEILFGFGKGIDYEKDPLWWNRPVTDPEYIAQIESYCGKCSMCVPLKKQHLRDKREIISPKLAAYFYINGSKYAKDPKYTEVFDGKITREDIESVGKFGHGWNPQKNRGDLPGGEP